MNMNMNMNMILSFASCLYGIGFGKLIPTTIILRTFKNVPYISFTSCSDK